MTRLEPGLPRPGANDLALRLEPAAERLAVDAVALNQAWLLAVPAATWRDFER